MAETSRPRGRQRLPRTAALALALVVVPAVMAAGSVVQDSPIRARAPSPRTVIAPDLIRVPDLEATTNAREEAAEAVEPVLVPDEEAVAAIVRQVRDAFDTAISVREAEAGLPALSAEEQAEALEPRLDMLDAQGLELLVSLDDDELEQVASETVGIAQAFARAAVREEALDVAAERLLQTEFAVRPLQPDVAAQVVRPVLLDALRPTVVEDEAATAEARADAAAEVAEVERTYARGTPIVTAGQPVDEVQLAALQARSLEGADPWRTLAEALALALVLTLVCGGYLRAYRPRVWASTRSVLLLSALLALSAVMLEAVSLLPQSWGPAWSFLAPVGALAMLVTILVDPPVGVLAAVPQAVIATFALPGEPGLVVFVLLASIGSVPLVSQLSARGDLRRAAWRSTLGYVALAAVCAGVFLDVELAPTAALAGLASGIATAVVLNGLLPFLESTFGICTATSLLDLADRNHPLLRELEQKALGSYNHSILVATMVERGCRAIGANALLAGVAALYHDIGKVRRPYFFVENQFGMANPHDELEPAVSAVIIQEHVTDGVAMAKVHRLPPEVVEGIATHHGTTLVAYFHRRALADARAHADVDEEHFRYKGRKPSSREMAVLMLADCCEGAARAAAQANRNLSTHELQGIVHGLVGERVEDGQLDDSALTFRDLTVVQASFIETLTGVYHPRIAYPPRPVASAADAETGRPVAAGAAATDVSALTAPAETAADGAASPDAVAVSGQAETRR